MSLNCLKKIEFFDWNSLSCMDRAILYAALTMNEESAIPFILLRYHFSEYLRKWSKLGRCDHLYYKKICQILGLDLELILCEDGELETQIGCEINESTKFVCAVDNYYQKDSNYYNAIHHPHFICLYGYASGSFDAYDEDYSGQFWIKENFLHGIRYVSKSISIDELKILANTQHLFDRKNACILYKISKKRSVNNQMSKLCKEYYRQLEYMVNNANQELDFLLHKISLFRSFQEEYNKEYRALVFGKTPMLEDQKKSNLKKLIKYPGGWCYAESRIKHIGAQKKFFELCSYNSPPINAFLEQFNDILHLSEALELQVAKLVITGSEHDFDIALEMFNNIYRREIDAYIEAIKQYKYFEEAINVFSK